MITLLAKIVHPDFIISTITMFLKLTVQSVLAPHHTFNVIGDPGGHRCTNSPLWSNREKGIFKCLNVRLTLIRGGGGGGGSSCLRIFDAEKWNLCFFVEI